jgi:hypothetical protein
MPEATITRLFVGSLIALAGGLVLLASAGALLYANSGFIMHGPDVVGVRATPFGWAMTGLGLVAILVMIAAAITQFVAWVGAVVSTAGLADKTWFVVLLVTGLLGFGFIAMIVYLIAGPGDPRPATARPATADGASRDVLYSRSA